MKTMIVSKQMARSQRRARLCSHFPVNLIIKKILAECRFMRLPFD
jgi:hypothetical protein